MDAMVGPLMGGIATPQDPKQAKRLLMALNAIALLRQEKVRGTRIDIETDSTISGNAEAEKEQRVNFIAAVTKFVETAAMITEKVPDFAPLAAKLLQFGVRGFRVGRDLESAIEEFAEKADQHAKDMANAPKPPSPEEIKAKTEQMKVAGEIERQKIENQGEQNNALLDLQGKQQDYKIKMLEAQIEAMKAHAEVEKIKMELAAARSEHAMNKETHEQKMELADKQHKHNMSQVGKDKGE